MKKTISFFLVMIVAIALMITAVVANKSVLTEAFWGNKLSFDKISKAVSDAEQNIYFLDSSLTRIGKIDRDGALQYLIDVRDREKGDSHLTYEIVVDQQGFLYALNLNIDLQNNQVKTEEIVRYSPEGKYVDVIYAYQYPVDQRPYRPGQFKNLKIKGNDLYFYSIKGEQLVLYKLALASKQVETLFEHTLPQNTYLANIVGTELGSIFYTTKRAEIFQISESGDSIRLFSSSARPLAERSFPVHVEVDPQNNLIFSDIGTQEINRIVTQKNLDTAGSTERLETLMTAQVLKDLGTPVSLISTKSLHMSPQGLITVATEDQLVSFQSNGKVELVLENVDYPVSKMLFRWLIWLLLILSIALFIYTVRFFYIQIMQRRMSIIFKQALVFVPLIIIALVTVAGVVYYNFSKKLDQEMYDKLRLLAHVGSLTIDMERVARIQKPEDFMNEDWVALDKHNHFMLKGNPMLDSSALYTSIYMIEDDQPYVLMYYNSSVGTYYPVDSFKEYIPQLKRGEIAQGVIKEAGGEWLFALAPLKNAEGQLVGMQEMGLIMRNFEEYKQALFWTTGKVITIITPIMVVIFSGVTFFILSTIRILRRSVNEIASGNWGTTVSINSRDEVADLGERFNYMSKYIQKYITEVTNLSQAYFPFVPQQFLRYLGKESILEVELGDQVELETTIMVAYIGSFYHVTKEMSSEEKFNLINHFAKGAGPIIRNHGGLINKYQDAGIIALFPNQTEHALQAAVEMEQLLEIFNQLRIQAGEVPIFTGIGIHKGFSIIGVVGEDQRFEGSVISDNVNIATLLEKLTHRLGASILVSENILEEIPNREQYLYRDLGKIMVDDREEPLRIFDVFAGDSEESRRIKEKTKELFEQGIFYYQEGRFFDARTAFIEVIKQNPEDQAAKLYFYLCDEYFQFGAPNGWQGTLQI